MYNTQCIYTSIYIGDIHCVTFFGDSYIHWVTVYTLGCMLVFVTFCYPMYIPYIHWGTRIYIGTQVHTFTDMNIHWVYTLCYNDNKHIHWVTLGIYIVVHFINFRSCYTMYITMFPNVYNLLGYSKDTYTLYCIGLYIVLY